MYKALIEIGGYNIGDEVPTDKAELWISMYKDAPVEKIEGRGINPNVITKAESSNAMHDDYIGRNADVVRKAIREDNLNKDTLRDLLKLEIMNKKRKPVIQAIKLKIKSI